MSEGPSLQKVVPGRESSLPNPYSKDFDRGEDSTSLSYQDYESSENHRLKFGRIAADMWNQFRMTIDTQICAT